MDRTGNSRLLQMQARFQQKQLQEREMKIASLYEAQQARALDRVRHSPSNGVVNGTKGTPEDAKVAIHPGKRIENELKIASLYEAQQTRALERVRASPSNGINQGKKTRPIENPKEPIHPRKVRQMFEERRTKGIDKSYPLQPIHNTERPAPRKVLPNGFNKVAAKTNGLTKTSTSTSKLEKKVSTRTMVKKSVKTSDKTVISSVNGSGDLNHNHERDLNHVKHTFPHNNGERITGIDEMDKVDNNYLLENETFPDALEPAPTPRSPEPKERPRRTPEPKEPKRPPRRTPTNKSSQSKPQPPPVAPPRKTTSDNSARRTPTVSASGSRSAVVGVGRTPSATTREQTAPGEPCSVCGRRFAPDRLHKHEEICRRAANSKKRKPFDALKHRLAGTEAEQFITKLRRQQNPGSNSSTKVSKQLNSSWRQKHEEFINAIRAAKQVKAHIAAGGKLSDLPPPPPSENPDYVQCPHCKRRFNEAAAQRHIPKCASYQFNKPKPPARR